MSKGASVPDQALVASDEARSDLHPPGFDPSRDDMVFRVAAAIARSNIEAAEPQTGRLSAAGIEQLVEHFSTKCVPETRAALAAMREPTEAMIEAAAATPGMKACNDAMVLHQARGYGFDADAFEEGSPLRQAWRAMIEAALAQGVYGASAMSAGTAETEGLRAKPASAAREAGDAR